MSLYKFTIDEKDIVTALIRNYVEAGIKLVEKAPPMEVKILGDVVRFRWVGIGRKYYHPVYVYSMYNKEKNVIVLVNKPRYPAYLMAIVGALYLSGFVPVAVINRNNELRAFVTPNAKLARALAKEMLYEFPLVSGRRFLELDVSYEGYLYKVPIGFVAFLSRKPMVEYDVIEEHEEYEEWRYPMEIPSEFWSRLFNRIIENK